MALAALNSLPFSFSELEKAMMLMKEHHEIEARIQLHVAQWNAALAQPLPQPVQQPVQQPFQQAAPLPPKTHRPRNAIFRLTKSPEEIAAIVARIDSKNFVSTTKTVHWHSGKHHPNAPNNQRIIEFLRTQNGQQAIKEQFLAGLPNMKWEGNKGFDELLRELCKQEIIEAVKAE
jgi:hypothetical protein